MLLEVRRYCYEPLFTNIFERIFKMKELLKIHKFITLVQVSVILLTSAVSSLGVVIAHPLIHYAAYALLACLASIAVSSLAMGIAMYLSRYVYVTSSDGKSKRWSAWVSWKKSASIWHCVVTEHGVHSTGHCGKKPAY